MHCGPQVKDVVADGQVVLEAEGLQHHAIPHGEREPQLVVVGRWAGGGVGEPRAHRSMGSDAMAGTHTNTHPWLHAQGTTQVWVQTGT